jgi:hypothetical protein
MFAAPLTAQMCDMEALHSSFGPFQQRQAHTLTLRSGFSAAFGTLPGLVDRPDKIPFAIQPFMLGVQRTPPAKTAIVQCEIEEATSWTMACGSYRKAAASASTPATWRST